MTPHTLFTWMVLSLTLATGVARGDGEGRDGTLILFLGADDAYATTVVRDRLDAYEALANELGVDLTVRTLDAGAPEEVVITPLAVFQNHRGRSIYQGRADNLDRVRNFVRTARVIPQSPEPLVRSDALVSRRGRAQVCLPVKITPLSGEIPEGFDPARFRSEVIGALAAGMKRFERASRVSLGRGDRSFHLDLHPYASGGLLFVSCEIYSQFNCHVPVYSALDDPVAGFWDDREGVLGDVAARFEREIDFLMSEAPSRDAFTPVGSEIPVVAWSALGLDLPPAPAAGAAGPATAMVLPRRWIIDPAAAPSVLFRFASPLDGYAGEAMSIDGTLDLGAGDLGGAGATFSVPVASITMGEPLLDKDLQTEHYFHAAAHPTAMFASTAFQSDAARLRFGEETVAVMRGRFTLKGHSVPIEVLTALEPILDDAGAPRLRLTAGWSLRINDPFGLTGPDGPSPARETVEFNCTLTLRPIESDARTQEP